MVPHPACTQAAALRLFDRETVFLPSMLMSLVTDSPVLTATCVSLGFVHESRLWSVSTKTPALVGCEFAFAAKRKYESLSAQRWERVASADVTQSWECTRVRACIHNQRIKQHSLSSLLQRENTVEVRHGPRAVTSSGLHLENHLSMSELHSGVT